VILQCFKDDGHFNNNNNNNIFQPVAVESLGPINASGRVFLSKLGRKLADQSDDDREISFFQRLSVLIQRYNAILLHDCFVKELDFCTFCIA